MDGPDTGLGNRDIEHKENRLLAYGDFYPGRMIELPVFFKAYPDFTDILRFHPLLEMPCGRPGQDLQSPVFKKGPDSAEIISVADGNPVFGS